jgi:hypothetical protein
MDVPGKFSPHTQQSGPGKGSTCCKQLWQTGTREMRVSGEKQIRQSEGKKTANTLSATARSARRAPGKLLGNRSALHGVRVRVRPPIRLKTTLPRKACRSRRVQYSRVVQGCAIRHNTSCRRCKTLIALTAVRPALVPRRAARSRMLVSTRIRITNDPGTCSPAK